MSWVFVNHETKQNKMKQLLNPTKIEMQAKSIVLKGNYTMLASKIKTCCVLIMMSLLL